MIVAGKNKRHYQRSTLLFVVDSGGGDTNTYLFVVKSRVSMSLSERDFNMQYTRVTSMCKHKRANRRVNPEIGFPIHVLLVGRRAQVLYCTRPIV